jgi:hypothetical protein
MYQMDIKYTNVFHGKILQNLPKLGVLVWNYTVWQPCFTESDLKFLASVWEAIFIDRLWFWQALIFRQRSNAHKQTYLVSFRSLPNKHGLPEAGIDDMIPLLCHFRQFSEENIGVFPEKKQCRDPKSIWYKKTPIFSPLFFRSRFFKRKACEL